MLRPSPKDHEPSFPIEMKPNMHQLYHHCKFGSLLQPTSCANADNFTSVFTVEVPHGEVIPHPTGVSRNRALSQKYSVLAEKCSSLCYSIISYAASRISSSQGICDNRAIKHYSQGVTSLRTVVDKASESATLAALTLVQHDLIFSHKVAVDAHMNGIYGMIEKKGGLAYLDGTIGQVALFCDYQASVLLDRPPKYRHPSLQDARPLHPPEITIGRAFPTCKAWQLVDFRLQEVIQDVCLMVEILERTRRLPTSVGDYQFFGYKRNVIENSLGFLHAEFDGSGTINECLCLGIILFQSMTIGGIDAINGIFDHLIPRFKVAVSLVHTSLDNLWASETEMGIWLMFIGAVIPDCYKRFRSEFLQKISKMLEALYGKGLGKPKARVRAGLSDYMWCDLMLSKRFNKAWKEIMSMSPHGDTATTESDGEGDDGADESPGMVGDVDNMVPGFATPQQPRHTDKGKAREMS